MSESSTENASWMNDVRFGMFTNWGFTRCPPCKWGKKPGRVDKEPGALERRALRTPGMARRRRQQRGQFRGRCGGATSGFGSRSTSRRQEPGDITA